MIGASVAERSYETRRRPRGRAAQSRRLLADVTSTLARRPSSRLDQPERERPEDQLPQQTIVCGVDASEGARHVVRVAGELGKRLAARLVLVHVSPGTVVPGMSSVAGAADEFRVVEAERGHRLLAELADGERLAAPLERRVAFGSPARALEAVARQEGADLIVVGCRRKGALASALLGSVSSELSRSAPCPVVVVPPAEGADPEATP